jgi:putative ABC transport system substrate-binding protein
VFVNVAEPVAQGFVASLARPGGNVTGFTNIEPAIGGKWLEILKEIAPRVARVALLSNVETAPYPALFLRSIESAGLAEAPLARDLPVSFLRHPRRPRLPRG